MAAEISKADAAAVDIDAVDDASVTKGIETEHAALFVDEGIETIADQALCLQANRVMILISNSLNPVRW